MGPILGVLFAALLTLGGVSTLMGIQEHGVANQRGAVTAGQLQTITSAAQAYIQAYGPQIEAVATASSPATITVPMLQLQGFLSTNTSAVNAYGQTWQVQVLQPQPGVLQALVLSQGGTPVPTQIAPAIAAMAGAEGGFVPAAGQYGSLNSTVAQGAYGGWQVPLTGYTNPGPGHLVALVQFNNGNLTNDYLYRVAVPGQPALNTMQTNLSMGGNSITNANNIAAQTVTLPDGDSLKIGAGYYYGDSSNTAVRQPGAFFVQHVDGSIADIYVGNSTAYRDSAVGGSLSVGGNAAVTGNVTANYIHLPSGSNYGVGSSMFAGNDVDSAIYQNGTLYIENAQGSPRPINTSWVQLAPTAWLGNGCGPNGTITGDEDGSGRLMVCVSGVWRYGNSSSTTTYWLPSGYPSDTLYDVGRHIYCATANTSEVSQSWEVGNAFRIYTDYDFGDGTYEWYMSRGAYSADGGAASCMN
ncbi:MAG: shufflon system plasmid conjugative transfer pilus tip adhesin PilV [Acetobacteraceae bacterium]|nr:shufflon system plasmid conjugative transfer pilus tip adhesin PilV [Acetobacteraceae bacterium]